MAKSNLFPRIIWCRYGF